MNTPAICAALRKRYPANSHALMFEVGNGTGHATKRHADAVAMGLWPSRGLEIEGIEIKISRGDWKRELADHAKSDAVQRYCDRWWIAAPKGLIPPAELPATWGLLEVDENGIRQKVVAPKLDAIPPDRGFIAAMLRRKAEADAAEICLLVEKALAPLREQDRRRMEQTVGQRTRDAEAMLVKAREIKEATGIDLLHGWTPSKEVSEAIMFGLNIGVGGDYGVLATLGRQAAALAEKIDALTKPKEQNNAPIPD